MNNQPFNMEKFLNIAKWNTLRNLYGSAHSSIIGFLSTTWLAQSDKHFVLDTPPADKLGQRGRRHADLLLCSDSTPIVIAEVESTVKNYDKKLETVKSYLDNQKDFSGLEFGLLFLLNWTGRKRDNYAHHWEELKTSILETKHNIALVSFKKERDELPFNKDSHPRLMEKQGCFPWRYTSIDFWFPFENQTTKTGNLWRKTD